MKIDIISDTVCPWCYIGKRKLESALAQRSDLDVEIVWHPFQLHPNMPPEGADREQFITAKFGSPEKARALYENCANAGAEVGIPFNFEDIKRSPNSLNSHRLIRWALTVGQQDKMVEILFRMFFIDGKDLGDRSVLVQAATEAGMDPDLVGELLDKGADVEMITKEDETARNMGVSGVPFFIIDDKYALSGAQDPAAFLQVFDQIAQDTLADQAAGE